MFEFLQPILLLSAAAIIIPVIIHLWNVKQSKTLKIGSIALLVQGSRQNARSLKLHDFLLLFLRCLLIALLAFLLAKTIWRQQISIEKKGWLMIAKEDLPEGYNRNKAIIDSLIKSGYEFHYFNDGFQKDELSKALQTQATTGKQATINSSYLNRLKELDQVAPAALEISVFVKNNLNSLVGTRPEVSLNVRVHTYVAADTTSSWIANAFLNSSDSVHVLIGHSKPFGTFYTGKNLSLSAMSSGELNVGVRQGKLMVSMNADAIGTDTSLVEIDTSTMRVTVLADKFKNDANYVEAAINSIRKFTKRKIQLSVTNNFQKITLGQDWIFWLSEQPLPAGITAENIFVYEKGKAENVHSWIVTGDATLAGQTPVEETKRIVQNASNSLSEVLWSDGFGNAILSKEEKNNNCVYHFFNRFDPGWNDLVWSGEFPKSIMQLLLTKEEHEADIHERRIFDEGQMQPNIVISKASAVNDKLIEKSDLANFFWLAAIIIFFIERLVSFKNKEKVSYG